MMNRRHFLIYPCSKLLRLSALSVQEKIADYQLFRWGRWIRMDITNMFTEQASRSSTCPVDVWLFFIQFRIRNSYGARLAQTRPVRPFTWESNPASPKDHNKHHRKTCGTPPPPPKKGEKTPERLRFEWNW